MRMHAVYAFNLLSNINYLRDALDIPYCTDAQLFFVVVPLAVSFPVELGMQSYY